MDSSTSYGEGHSSQPWPCSSEDDMQRAGRNPANTFRDFRSARHAHQRSIKRPRKMRSRKEKRIRGFYGYERNTHHVNECFEARQQLQQREGEDAYYAINLYNWRIANMNHLRYYANYNNWGDVQVIGDGGDGEDFGMWARRRIEEMRRVKEDRIRRRQPTTQQATQQANNHVLQNEITTSPKPSNPAATSNPIPTTTLPIDLYDIRGHRLLHDVLTPSEYQAKWLRRRNKPFLPKIHGFEWFGEFSWAWHRDANGDWEMGGPSCEGAVFHCTCCGIAYGRCFCKEFEDKALPQDLQSCALVEWTKDDLRDILEKQHAMELERDAELDIVSEAEEEVWEVMYDATSHDWDIVSECGDPEGSTKQDRDNSEQVSQIQSDPVQAQYGAHRKAVLFRRFMWRS